MSSKSKEAFDHKAYHTRRRNAESLRDQGLYSKAADLFGRNLAVSSEYFNNDHANVLNDRDDLSECLYELGQCQAAITIYEETLRLRHHLDKEAEETTNTRLKLAYSLKRSGQFERAIALYQTALTVRKRTLGDTHPDILYTRQLLASTFHTYGNVDEAFRHNRYLLDILAKSRPAEDYNLIICKYNLAVNWCAFRDYEPAMQLTVESLQALRKTRPSGDSQLRRMESLRKNIDRDIQCQRRERRTEPGVTASASKEGKAVPPNYFHQPGIRDHGDETRKTTVRNKSSNMYDARDGSGSLYTFTT